MLASLCLWRSYSYGTDTITVEPELLLIGSDYVEGLISKMRNIYKSTPPSFGRRENAAAIVKAPAPGALTKGPDRKFPGLHPPLGGATSPSLSTNRRFAFPILALLAALAVGLLFLLPGGPLHAQDADGPIMYAENGTDPVATFTAVDPEGDGITWTLTQDGDAEDFIIVGGVLAFAAPPDFETPADSGEDNTYEVTVTASDGTNEDTEDVRIQVTNVEEPGTVTLSTLQPQVEVELTATLSDSDMVVDGTPTWMWYRGSSVIAGAVGATYTPMPGDVGSILEAKATYMDGEDAENDKTAEATSAHAVRAKPETNIAPAFPTPIAETAQTREVAENTPSGRNIGASVVASDPGDVLTYSIDATAEQTFDIDRATGQLKTQAPLNADAGGTATYTVTVTATDPFGAAAPAEVTITVTDVDEDPLITTSGATTAISFAEGTEATPADIDTPLDTYAATDPENQTISWDVSGPDAGKFEISEAGALTFEEQPNFETSGDSNRDNVYEVTVVASDPAGNSDELDVRVTVTDVGETGTITFSSRQPKVGAALTATLTDDDGSITDLKWQWSSSDNERTDAFEDATSDTYTPVAADVGDTLTVTATYRDGSLAADAEDLMLPSAATAAVAPDTDNKAPRFLDDDDEVITTVERTIVENTDADMEIGAPVDASDPMPAGTQLPADVLTYTLGGTDAASFDINDGTGQLMTKAALDHEAKRSYTVTVTATDPGGLSATVTVTIEVMPVNEDPVLDGEAPEEYAENGGTPVATFTASDPERAMIIWTLTGDDTEDFTIVGGVLRFSESPNFEAAADNGENNTYEVTVTASDGTNEDTEDVRIQVTNVEEPGTVTLSTLQPQVEVELTATLSDPDGGVNNNNISWMWFRGSSTIVNAITAEYTPVTGDVGSKLKAKATYRDAEDAEKDKTAEGSSARSVRSVPASGNTAPAFPDQNPSTPMAETAQTREVAENTPSGRNIGASVVASDRGDVLTYSIDATAEQTFDIDRATGQLKTQAPLNADAGGTATYTVTVTATDPFGVPATAVVTITVTDVDEDPLITTSAEADTAISFAEGTEATPAVIDIALRTYAATDPENQTISWDVSGPDAGKFEISEAGALTFEEQPNFETSGDSNRDNVYEVTVVASDPAGNSDELDVRVTVTDVDETGTITFSSRQPKVGAALTATLTDDDGSITDLKWQWSSSDNERTDAFEDATSDTYTPVAADVGDTLTVTATYRDGSLAADAEDLMLPSAATAAVAPDTDNKAPRFLDDDDEVITTVERTIVENTDADMEIGAPVVASDPALATELTPDVLTYTLGGVDAAVFRHQRRHRSADDESGSRPRGQAELHGDGEGHRPRWSQRNRHGDY